MYDYISGKFSYKITNAKGCFVTIEASGVGYFLEILPRDFDLLPEVDEELKIYCVLLHKEDKMSLCGFLKREDRDIFNVLTSVSGVGAKMALTLLNSFKVIDLVSFVIDGDYKELTKAKGVGPKLAQKIIIELKDKLISYQTEGEKTPRTAKIEVSGGHNVEDARGVLLSLGYEKSEVDDALSRALKSLSDGAEAEEILKKSLQLLSL